MNLRELKDAGLDSMQVNTRAEVEHFAQTSIAPVIAGYERRAEYPRDLLAAIAERGWFGAVVPKEHGGLGLDFVSYGIIIEELARADRVCASAVHVQNSLLNYCLLNSGSDDQRERYLRKLAKGEWFSAACFTEPEIGSDLSGVQLLARRDGDDYVLNGTKTFISHAEVASLLFVLASVNPEIRQRGTIALLVETSTPGVRIERIPMATMQRGSICRIYFEDARVSIDQRVREEGDGIRVSTANLDIGRFSVASQALGQAQAALDAALEWAGSRQQFGQPIGKFQMIQQKLADMITAVETARLLVYRVGHLKNHGVGRVSMEAAMAKAYATEMATKVALDAIQILGGRGLSEEFYVSRIPLEAKVLEIAEGSNEIQRMLVAEYALGFRKQ